MKLRPIRLAPFLILGSLFFVYSLVSLPAQSSRVHRASFRLNIVSDTAAVRRQLFGVYKHPVLQSELAQEEAWRRRYSRVPPARLNCNRLSAISNSTPTMRLQEAGAPLLNASSSFFLTNALPASARAAEEAVEAGLRRAGLAVQTGGWHRPRECTPREVVAVVVPYRNRHRNLVTFLAYMHRFLQRQRRHYVVVVAEQANEDVRFNRAKLFNAAVREVMREWGRVDCLILHDVDKLPLHLFNLYGCSFQPRQLLRSLWTREDEWLNSFYPGFLGGVTAFTKWQLLRMNGASNDFFGWGGEDDDLQCRTRLAGYLPSVVTPPAVGRFMDVQHHDDTRHEGARYEKLVLSRVIRRMRSDGLRQVRYRLVSRKERALYTVFSFDLVTNA